MTMCVGRATAVVTAIHTGSAPPHTPSPTQPPAIIIHIQYELQRQSPPRTQGDVGFVIEFGGVCYQDTYPMYLACILHVFRMYLDVIRSYTSRYTKIHQDTSRYICIYLFGYHGNVSYLGICILLYDTFKIHSKYF